MSGKDRARRPAAARKDVDAAPDAALLDARALAEIAARYRVPLHAEAATVAALAGVDGATVPSELFDLVADVVRFACELDEDRS